MSKTQQLAFNIGAIITIIGLVVFAFDNTNKPQRYDEDHIIFGIIVCKNSVDIESKKIFEDCFVKSYYKIEGEIKAKI